MKSNDDDNVSNNFRSGRIQMLSLGVSIMVCIAFFIFHTLYGVFCVCAILSLLILAEDLFSKKIASHELRLKLEKSDWFSKSIWKSVIIDLGMIIQWLLLAWLLKNYMLYVPESAVIYTLLVLVSSFIVLCGLIFLLLSKGQSLFMILRNKNAIE